MWGLECTVVSLLLPESPGMCNMEDVTSWECDWWESGHDSVASVVHAIIFQEKQRPNCFALTKFFKNTMYVTVTWDSSALTWDAHATLIVYSITHNSSRRIVYLTTWCSGMHLQQGILYSSILVWYSRTDMVPQGLSWLLAPSQCLLWTWLFSTVTVYLLWCVQSDGRDGGSGLY